MSLPDLPYAAWTDTRTLLHLVLQIVGKVRLCLMPRKNHWWYITLHVTPRGLATGAIPLNEGEGSFEIEVDLLNHRVHLATSSGDDRLIALHDGRSVAEFYRLFRSALDELGIGADIIDRPFDIQPDDPFPEIESIHRYDASAADRYRRALIWVDSVFKEFSGRFYGKTSPVQLFWHHMDLAVTRFSGRRVPEVDPEARISDRDAYSHEVVSFGFWTGDETLPEPAFYSYTFPLPGGMEEQSLVPAAAEWNRLYGSPMAILRYADVRGSDRPREMVLDFLESAYRAGAGLAGWDLDNLNVPPLDEL